jgi:opacity protein-like surface antigen
MNRYRSLKSLNKPYCIAFAMAMLTTSVQADDAGWQLHGALTQGAVYTSENNFFGPSDDNVSLKFTEISFNASGRLLPNLRAAGQVLYRQAGAQGEGGGIDYAFFDYQFFTATTFTAGIRAGRYKLPIGLYNETRDIAFTRPSIFVPQSAYPDRSRDLQLSADGGLFYTDIFTNTGQWTLEFDAGQPRIDKETVKSTFAFGLGDVDSVGKHSTYGGRVMYQSSDGVWLAAFSRADARVRYKQTIISPLITDVDVRFIYWIASLQCNIDQWTFTGEYGHIDMKIDFDKTVRYGLHPLFYYFQATRHLDKHWSIYSRYDNLYWDRRDPSGQTYSASSIEPLEPFANFAHDYGFGARYDISNNAMVSAEYHYIDGTAWLSGLDNSNATTRYWNMFAVEFSYRF